MRAAFIFDTVLLEDGNSNFYGMTLTYDFFKERYLINFDSIIVCTRVKKKNDETGNISGYKKTNGNNVEVRPIREYRDIPDALKKRNKIISSIEEIIKDVDILIIRMPSVLGIYACKCAEKYKKKYMIEMVACAWDGYCNHARLGGKIIAPFMYYYTRKAIKKSKNVLYVTENFLQRRYPNNYNTIACSDVILKQYDNNLFENRLEKIKEMKMNNLKLVTVANVGLKSKGQEYVFKAINKLKNEGFEIQYYLIGGGDNSRLKKLATKYNVEKEIVFVGSLNHDDVFNTLAKMDLYIQPSLQEGLPRALIEAMSIGCPAIGSNAGGIPELLDESYIFKKRDWKNIITIIKNLSVEKLLEAAEYNYKKSKKYNRDSLETIRNKYYKNL